MSGDRYHPGGILKPGAMVLRNDTGRNLGPDEWHLLTLVGEIPPGVDADAFIKWVLPKPGERFYTADEVRKIGETVFQKLMAELNDRGKEVDEGRAVPASPTTEVVTLDESQAGTNTVTIGFDAAADGEITLVAVDADGKMVQW